MDPKESEEEFARVKCPSSATMLLSIGVYPKVVQEILGHCQISMRMDIYSHVLPAMQQEAAGKLNNVLQG